MIIKSETHQKIIVFGVLTTYFAVVPGLGETQPILLLGIALISFWYSLKKVFSQKEIKIKKLSFYFCVLLGLLCLYGLISSAFITSGWVTLGKYIIAFLIFWYLFVHINIDAMPLKLLYLVIIAIFCIAILQKIKLPIISDFIISGLGVLMPRASDSLSLGSRGTTILAPEQSYMALMLTTFTILIEAHPKKRNNLKYFFISRMLIFFTFLMINALMGYLCLFLFFIAKYLTVKKVIPLVVILFFILIFIDPTSRVGQLIYALNISGGFLGILSVISAVEPSGSTRVFLSLANIYTGVVHPLGSGVGAASNLWYFSLNEMGMSFISNHEVLGEQFTQQLATTPQTLFLAIFGDYGLILTLLLVVPIFLKVFSFEVVRNLDLFRALVFFAFVLLFFQSGLTSPYIGVVLALMYQLKQNYFKRGTV